MFFHVIHLRTNSHCSVEQHSVPFTLLVFLWTFVISVSFFEISELSLHKFSFELGFLSIIVWVCNFVLNFLISLDYSPSFSHIFAFCSSWACSFRASRWVFCSLDWFEDSFGFPSGISPSAPIHLCTRSLTFSQRKVSSLFKNLFFLLKLGEALHKNKHHLFPFRGFLVVVDLFRSNWSFVVQVFPLQVPNSFVPKSLGTI